MSCINSVLERNWWCPNKCGCSFGSFCFLLMGRIGFIGSGQIEICSDGFGFEVWWYAGRESTEVRSKLIA